MGWNARNDVRFGSKADICMQYVMSALHPKMDMSGAKSDVRLVPEADMVGPRRTLSVKTLDVGARHGGIASRGARDADRVDFVRHSAVRVFPHVHHHRGDRLAYPADPEKRERALLAPLNVLFSCHRR